MKKIIAIFMAVLMLLSVLAVMPVAAEDASISVWDGTVPEGDAAYRFSGRGTKKNPYLIENAEQLAQFAANVRDDNTDTCYRGMYFKLTTDIDLGNHPWYPIGGWSEKVGVAKEQTYFAGHFDGAGHVIKNFVPATTDADGTVMHKCGFFGWISGATVSNVGLESSQAITYSGNTRSAGLVGLARYSFKISNCYYKGDMVINATGACDIGAILGWSGDALNGNPDVDADVYKGGRSIESCYYVGKITINDKNASTSSTTIRIGGIAGRYHDIGTTFSNVYSDCDIHLNFENDRSAQNGAAVTVGLVGGDVNGTGTCEGVYCEGKITYTGKIPKASNIGMVFGNVSVSGISGQDIEYKIADGSQIIVPRSERLIGECPDWLLLEPVHSFSIPVVEGTNFLEYVEPVSIEVPADQTQPVAEETTAEAESTQEPAQDNGGCGSVIGTGAAALSVLSIGMYVLATKKSRKDD